MPRVLFLCFIVAITILVIVQGQTYGPTGEYNDSLSLTEINATNTTGTRAVSTLQFVILVARHGSRGSVFSFPSSRYQSNDRSVWPHGFGELTQRGRIQMYKLGENVRSMYNGFLDSTYRSVDFKALSSPSGRTIQSAELFLAGLFPPHGFQVWNQDLLWQPIPVFPSFLDHYKMVFIKGHSKCPRFTEAQTNSLLQFDKLYDASLTSFLEYVLPHSGIDEETVRKSYDNLYRLQIVILLWESLNNEAENGLPLPDWASEIYPEPLTSLYVALQRVIIAGSADQIKYLQGELFQELVGLMQSKANNTLSPNRRMYYYSAHDYTLLALLAMLGQQAVDEVKYVNTGSALIYELHRHASTGRFYIQVLYIDGHGDLVPIEINISECESPCDFEQFLKTTEQYSNITNWLEECHLGPATT
ncbi:lysosomal acid phosphatase-like [Homalodisca vitripennis]|uniref:lysosomal acid phosphatase-like n=1 Tax=Homalodisca vitripennis TaxID=197043 RepID=UPI001EEB38BD|nr:lysosomal acid phosphatase-like [Homalodisca vitripennis]